MSVLSVNRVFVYACLLSQQLSIFSVDVYRVLVRTCMRVCMHGRRKASN